MNFAPRMRTEITCSMCGGTTVLVESYDNPDVCAGSRVYRCAEHPHHIKERLMWYCPYVPLTETGEAIQPKIAFETAYRLRRPVSK